MFAFSLASFVVTVAFAAHVKEIETPGRVHDMDLVSRVLDELIEAVDATDATRLEDRGEKKHWIVKRCHYFVEVTENQVLTGRDFCPL